MISFIVIGKNEGERLLKCFKSILLTICKNGIKDHEILFVDSNSTDNSIDIAKNIGNIRIFRIEGKCNAAIGRNIGAKESKGEILVFIDGDMEIEVDFLNHLIKNNRLIYPFVSGIYSHYYIDMNNPIKVIDKGKKTFTGGFFVIKRELWLQIHGMDNKLKVNEDIDINIRLSKINIPPLIVPEICIIHHTAKNKLFHDFINRTLSYKYVSILARKHFGNLIYWRDSIRKNYTSFFLFIVLLISIIKPLSLIIYLLLVTTRIFIKDKKKNRILLLLHYIIRDIVFIISFILFWPRQPRILYKEIFF